MALPKFDKISVELSQRIGDGVPTSASAGNKLTADERTALVNQALFLLFEQGWEASKGDIKSFIDLFPELVKTENITTDANGISVLATPILDFHTIISGLKSTTYIKPLPKHLYTIVKSSRFDDYTPNSANPVVFEISNTLSFFPSTDFNAQVVTIEYIRVPLVPTTGAFITLVGTTDSPFSDKWNSKIASIAEDQFRIIAQEKGQ